MSRGNWIHEEIWQDGNGHDPARIKPLKLDWWDLRGYHRNENWYWHGIRAVTYFVQASRARGGLIKIGMTESPEQRFRDLQKVNVEPLTWLAEIQSRSKDRALEIERDLHNRFWRLHRSHEWFDPGFDLVEFINTDFQFSERWEFAVAVVPDLSRIKTNFVPAAYKHARLTSSEVRRA